MIVTSERGKNHCVIEFLKKKKVLLKIVIIRLYRKKSMN